MTLVETKEQQKKNEQMTEQALAGAINLIAAYSGGNKEKPAPGGRGADPAAAALATQQVGPDGLVPGTPIPNIPGRRPSMLERLEAQPHLPNRPGRIYSPVLSPEEAFLSIQPYMDYYKAHRPPVSSATNTVASISQALGLVSAISAIYRQLSGKTAPGVPSVAGGAGGARPGAAGAGGQQDTSIGGQAITALKGLKELASAVGLDWEDVKGYFVNKDMSKGGVTRFGDLMGGGSVIDELKGTQSTSGSSGIETAEDILGPLTAQESSNGTGVAPELPPVEEGSWFDDIESSFGGALDTAGDYLSSYFGE